VQPAEPLDLWTTPAFEPTVRGGNLFARGTADDKGQVHIHLKALESIKALNGKLGINVKVLIEGEEEVGSVSLWDYVQKNREKLKADALVVSDTSMLAKGVPSITYGLRGLNYYQIELTGPARDLHSGVYGGAVPNPLTILTELFSRLHDKNFKVTSSALSALPATTAKRVSPSWSGCGLVQPSNSTASGAVTRAKAPKRLSPRKPSRNFPRASFPARIRKKSPSWWKNKSANYCRKAFIANLMCSAPESHGSHPSRPPSSKSRRAPSKKASASVPCSFARAAPSPS
jgi:acetylornithine deacetylase/succinyl-diaminopimelate desuccinylase-like protein